MPCIFVRLHVLYILIKAFANRILQWAFLPQKYTTIWHKNQHHNVSIAEIYDSKLAWNLSTNLLSFTPALWPLTFCDKSSIRRSRFGQSIPQRMLSLTSVFLGARHHHMCQWVGILLPVRQIIEGPLLVRHKLIQQTASLFPLFTQGSPGAIRRQAKWGGGTEVDGGAILEGQQHRQTCHVHKTIWYVIALFVSKTSALVICDGHRTSCEIKSPLMHQITANAARVQLLTVPSHKEGDISLKRKNMIPLAETFERQGSSLILSLLLSIP